MIAVTDRAKEHLTRVLATGDLKDDASACFRLERREDGDMVLIPGAQTGEDFAVVDDDRVMLVLRREFAEHLAGRRIDLEPTEKGRYALVIA